MTQSFRASRLALAIAAAGFAAAPVSADDSADFGAMVERTLQAQSERLFGFGQPLRASAPATTGAYRTPSQRAVEQVLTARGLRVEYLTRQAANSTDMMAFYPAARPSHLITCVEGGRATLGDGSGRFNPSIQRIELKTGRVETLLRGLTACDGIRTTPWGTILATEETSSGGAYEIIDPLNTTENTVTDRALGTISGPTSANIVKRIALPTMAWEGLAVLPSGVVIAGDELRPGTGLADADGGAIFKFVPATARSGDAPIASLADSPLTGGRVYAMQVSCQGNVQQFGQGCEIGNAAWIEVSAATARADADRVGATGYYRPEDLHEDPMFRDSANPDAVRFCWTNTGNGDAQNWAEVLCGIDAKPLVASATERSVVVNRFIEGDSDFNSHDNLAFQPRTGNVYVIEDDDNGDIFACLPDGEDRDIKSDGCVKMLSVRDSSAEPTGFLFTDDGTTAYLSIQHSNDTNMPLVDGYPTDDVLRITGFRVRR